MRLNDGWEQLWRERDAARAGCVTIMSRMAKKNQTPPKSFEDALRELDQILADIESGDVGLEENLVKYERGSFLIQHCRTVLRQAEQQIELLAKSADGGIETSPAAGTDPDQE